MATLIELRGGDGRLIGRCDAHCYEARGETCHCVCHGRNHGQGLAAAMGRNEKIGASEVLIPEGFQGVLRCDPAPRHGAAVLIVKRRRNAFYLQDLY